MGVKTYKDLIVWQKGMTLVTETYLVTEKFPSNEIYGLCSQMQRAAVSVPSNIAEGYFKRHKKQYIEALSVSLDSAAELETQVLACQTIKGFSHIDFSKVISLLDEIIKMLYVMIRKAEESTKKH